MTNQKLIRKSTGITSGMGITLFFMSIFEANEMLSPKQRLTDSTIARRVAKEFPHRKSAQDFIADKPNKTVNSYRYRYNTGKFTRKLPPAIPSFRYNKQGQIVNFKTGSFLLTEQEIQDIKEAHKKLRTTILKGML